MRVCIIGLGYIGLPTATIIAKNKHEVLGVDLNPEIVEVINQGIPHIKEKGLSDSLAKVVKSGFLRASISPQKSDIFIIAVPTPLIKESESIHKPNTDFVFSAIKSILKVLSKGNTIIIESTSPVGTTQKIAKYVFQLTGLSSDDINYAYCPERVIPGKIMEELENNNRIVGGLTDKASTLVRDFYATFTKGLIEVTNTKTAEMVKLAENSFRDVNIAFANEISLLCDHLNIDTKDLIKLSNYHPRVNILSPGIGVGGHCIAIDPWFLVAEEPNITTLIQSARIVNKRKTDWVISKIQEFIKKHDQDINKDSSIGCLGLSYKPDVDDIRESPALEIVRRLIKLKINAVVCEPNISSIEGIDLLDIDTLLRSSEIIVILVAHESFKEIDLSGKKVIDFCGVID